MRTGQQRGLAPSRLVLGNGAVIITLRTAMTPAVTISAAIRAGSVADPPALPGAAHFLSRVLDRGTERQSGEQIAEMLDSRGVSLNIGTSRHVMTAWCTALAEDLEPMLDIVADVIRRPVLSDEEIEIRRSEIVTGIRQDEDNPAVMAVEALLALLYPDGHPYGRRIRGSVEAVQQVSREDLVRFHRTWFTPSSLSLVVVGDVDPHEVMEAVERLFGDWQGPAAPPLTLPPVPGPVTRRRLVVPMMSKAQADIAYGFVGIARTDSAYHPFSVMNNVLGQYALGGRLGDSIRERQGMAYYVFSALDANVAPGPFMIRAGVDPRNVDRAVASIDEELRRMVTAGVTGRELEESKNYLVGSLPRMLETNAGIASFLQAAEQFGLGLDYAERLPGLIRAVTLDEANATARRYLAPQRAALVVAGPYGETETRDSSSPGLAASQ